MAKIKAPFTVKGKIGHLSIYSMRGVKEQVARQPFGPSAHDIQTKPAYDITRRLNQEFKGCSLASRYLRRNFHPLEPVRDYPMSGPITGWMRDFLPLDTESKFGRRHILLSRNPRLLEGINLSGRYPFDSVVRGGITWELSRESFQARIDLPALQPGINFSPMGKQPYFKVAATLGLAPDVLWTGQGYSFDRAYEQFHPVVAESEWTPTAEGAEAMTLELQLPYTPPDDHFALVLTLGILMGTAGRRGRLEAVRYAGCGKVLAAG
jgi:hypothetical protein